MADTTAGGAAGDEPGTAPEPNPETSTSGTGRTRGRARKRVAPSPMAEAIPGLDLDDLGSPRSDDREGTAAEPAVAPRARRKATRPSAATDGPAVAAAATDPTEAAGPAPAKRTRRPAKRAGAEAMPAGADTPAGTD